MQPRSDYFQSSCFFIAILDLLFESTNFFCYVNIYISLYMFICIFLNLRLFILEKVLGVTMIISFPVQEILSVTLRTDT